ncbi:beta-glucosidase [Actinomadura parmotrematis]|uniref:Glycoside hydrolase family 3 C-terminal domain-containing protein n=1 Tax=Actinomadura parmotrematis TaxID=2864039 RepID=A0ABS7G4E0_9ACTN|nr:glycoside hydrolase family 3 C-terminal domain-containing protein [Actinomadura parmotrematis]MBW8487346.1 glycoside hydrolase family 3 C-terminal domain-containing protein [Actinomadura parmotrematis]
MIHPSSPRPRRSLALALAAAAAAATVTVPAPQAAASAARCPWTSGGTPESRARRLVAAMTLDDEIRMVTGIGLYNPASPNRGASGVIPGNPALCVPDLVLNDSSGGIGFQQKGTTAFPQGIAQGATWDPALIRAYGGVLADEAMRKGVNVVLGPGMNMARNPRSGRNLEYAGEDPYLTGRMAAGLVRGIQSRPVIATAKHFLLNEQEYDRNTSSSEVDERTLREIYLPPFQDALDAGAGSVMCSYNRVASVHACENKPLLHDLLKDELGFDGFVMSDWGATHSTAPSANAGLDMEMAGDGYFGVSQLQPAAWGAKLKAAVTAGTVPRSRLDDMVRRIATPMFRLGLFEHPPVPGSVADARTATTPASLAMAGRIAREGSVLLKNSGGLLPLAPSARRIAVIGLPASRTGARLASQGFGSNHVPTFGLQPGVTAPLDALRDRAARGGAKVVYDGGALPALAAARARDADVAIVFVHNAETEGNDRADLKPHQAVCNPFLAAVPVPNFSQCLRIPGDQDALVSAVAKANPNTVVVLQNGGPLEMPWLGSVRSVVENWYPGQVDGDAIAALLFGDADFSGKLPVTFPRKLADGPLRTKAQYPGVTDAAGVPHSTYSEKLLIGYRWYQARNIQPLFPFGYGLSYTRFAHSDLRVTPAAGGGATVTAKVTNTGRRTGADVTQVYLRFPASTGEPPLQLKGFDRTTLEPGQTATVTVRLDARAFAVWKNGAWTTAPGCYRVHVGDSSANLPLTAPLARAGGTCTR